MVRGARLAAAFGLAFALATPALAAGGMCGAPDEPVFLVVVGSKQQVAGAAHGLSRAPALVNESDTVIFADGRAVTSDLAAASRHLNALGWAERRIEIAGAGASRRAPPASPSKSKRRRRG
ncbi:MAG: hypothetical protein ABFS41_17340 [Myxococcota bacterium]